MSNTPKIAIIYYSGYGHTQVVAEKIAEGIQKCNATSTLFNVKNTLKKVEDLEVLRDYDAIVFGSPTYMGSFAADLKAFMELTSNPIWTKNLWKNKIAACFVNSAGMSGDKLNTAISLAIFAAQHGMIWVGNVAQSQNLAAPGEPVNRLGGWLGLLTQSDATAGPDIAPPQEDRFAAECFGKRITEITTIFKKGSK